MMPPLSLSLDVEVWADREEELEVLRVELNQAENEKQHEPEGVQ